MPPYLTENHALLNGNGSLFFQDKDGNNYNFCLKGIKNISMESSCENDLISNISYLASKEYRFSCECDSITMILSTDYKEINEQELKNLMED